MVDTSSPERFAAKAPDLAALASRATKGQHYLVESGADFLDRLRLAFSETFFRRVLVQGNDEFAQRHGCAPGGALMATSGLNNDALWRMRRDLLGCKPKSPARQAHPHQEPAIGMTLLELRAAGGEAAGSYWRVNGQLVRVLRAPNAFLHSLKHEYETDVAPAAAPDIVVAVGAEDLGLPPSIARNAEGSIARGGGPKWMTRAQAGTINAAIAPPDPLDKLCSASLIRDEKIASFSLDLSEAERYGRLRQAIGVSDADVWIERAAALVSAAKRRNSAAKAEVAGANDAIANATRRIDEARASLASDQAVSEAVVALSGLLGHGQASPDQLISPAREFIAETEKKLEDLSDALEEWDKLSGAEERLIFAEESLEDALDILLEAKNTRAALPELEGQTGEDLRSALVGEMHELHRLGSHVGLLDNRCPLCAAEHDEDSFAAGVARMLRTMDEIDAAASAAAAAAVQQREELDAAEHKIERAQAKADEIGEEVKRLKAQLSRRIDLMKRFGLGGDTDLDEATQLLGRLRKELATARHALKILNTLGRNVQLERAAAALEEARFRLSRAQDRAGKSRRAEALASALHDAARRAASETLDLRLQRVLPLISELYGRLRPHPVWQSIDYSIRGDLRRFLSLQVGEGLNPQFIFSSGQRRATG